MGGDGDLTKGPGPGPASLQAASPPEEGEAPVAAAAPPSLEALLALFSTGDLGKKLYSVLCRDIATVGKAQPFYRAKRLEAQHLPRGACWREIRGEVRRTEGTLVPAANRQAPRQARAVSLQRAPGPAPSGCLATW